MTTASPGHFNFRPCRELISGRLSVFMLVFLAGLFCLCASASAESAGGVGPGENELRYELPGSSGTPQTPLSPPADVAEKPAPRAFSEPPEQKSVKPTPPKPRQTPPAPPVAEAEGPKYSGTIQPGDTARSGKASVAATRGGGQALGDKEKNISPRDEGLGAKSEVAQANGAAPLKEDARREAPLGQENITPAPAPEPEARDASAQREAYRVQDASMGSVTRNYPGYDEVRGEDIGYGAAVEPTGAERRGEDKPLQAAPPPAIKAHERAPEERGKPREETHDARVPQDIGPYAWVPASEAPPPKVEGAEPPWELSANKVTAYNQNSVVDAEGEVFLQHGHEYIKADFGRYFSDTGWVYLKGNVEIYFGSDRLKGQEAEFDLANKVGWVKNGQVFMSGPHVYLKGERVNKNWGDTYAFRNAKITTCDGDVPAWSLYAEDAVVELDGYARLWGSSLAIKDRKVAYTPYLVIPAKRDRQSGFLVPHAGQDRRKGFYWNQPYFWAIDDSRDMTLNAYIMTDRGVMMGAEYRSKQEWDENLWLRADYLHDSVTWDKRSDNYFNQSYLRTNSDRFWLRGMYNGTPLPDRNWKVKANLDYVSDAYFLREFKNDPQGFDSTRDYLSDSFGRTLAPWSSNRISEGVIYRDWDRITVSAGMRYEQNPFLDNGNTPRSKDTLAQKLPDINMYLHKGRIWSELPVEAEGEAQAVYFYRREGTKGMRYDLNPKLSIPLRNDYGSLIPQATLRGSLYQTGSEGRILGDTGNNSDDSRLSPEVSLAAFTELARNYTFDSAPIPLSEKNVGQRRWSGMRHSIQPRINYVKRWDINQDDLPYFDTIDRLPPRDEVVYSLTNLLTVRRESVRLDKNNKPVTSDDYIDFLRFKLESGYDFDEARRTWKRDAYERRPFMDILADITVAPGNWFSINSQTWWSPYNGEFTRLDNSVRFWEPSVGSLTVGLDSRRRPDEYKRWSSEVLYRDLSLLHRGLITEDDIRINRYRKPVDLLYTDIKLNYFAPITFSLQQWYDLRGNEELETHLSVIYTHQCYQLEAYFWKDTHDESYGLSLSLPGFWN